MGSLPNVKSTVLEAQDLLASARQLREKIKKHDDCATDLLLRGRSVQRREAAVQELHTALDAHSAVPFLRATRTTVLRELHHERRVLQVGISNPIPLDRMESSSK
jgi:translation initiation factor IF-3